MKVHSYTSQEAMLHVNAFIVEGNKSIVLVDTTLTMSDSKALKSQIESIGKPLAGIVLTHGHPDHVAGTYNIIKPGEVPVYAIPSVKTLMEKTEQSKHKQWSAMFGDEWVPQWVYPDQTVNDGDTISFDDLTFKVLDIGAGGDCDANSIWLLEGEPSVAFVGDFVYHQNHTYMADGNILRWIANINRYAPILKNYKTYYVGHGPACDYSILEKQKHYFENYCSALLKHTSGTAIFSEESKKSFELEMLQKYPSFGCQFMVALSADAVAKELVSEL